ncbi:MAG: SurA N-terminal domain-containing protein [Bacillota bacterium]|nr:SurA N-terminal domain-containing protein [Bacillota bacterium]MDW7676840.1 SurA N-terminal domain-containing protein [Bacillota bacterium]
MFVSSKMKKSMLLMFLAAALVFSACSAPAESEEAAGTPAVEMGEPVASVNGEFIYTTTFNRVTERMIWSYEQQGMDFEGEEGEVLRQQVEESVLDHLIQQAVMVQEAKNRELVVADEEVEAEFDALKSRFDTEEAFQEILDRTQFTESELKETLKTEMTIEALLAKAVEFVEVAEEEIVEFYTFYESQYAMQQEAMEESGEELSEEELAKMQLPPYEEMKDNLRMQLLQEKQQEAVMAFVDQLMEQSDIEILM